MERSSVFATRVLVEMALGTAKIPLATLALSRMTPAYSVPYKASCIVDHVLRLVLSIQLHSEVVISTEDVRTGVAYQTRVTAKRVTLTTQHAYSVEIKHIFMMVNASIHVPPILYRKALEISIGFATQQQVMGRTKAT